ncbi:hypothetical protein J9303_15360 [Bacillaceae bacterium Marseille-Q3522]|nr:hypothetical protein [Bacillaceae bacterium Marseille-Q3522]
MISSFLIIFFSIISLAGVIYLFLTKKNISMNQACKLTISVFTLSHFHFLVLGICKLFFNVSLAWLLIAIILVIISRIVNGLTLYGKNNFSHYLVTGTIALIIIIFHINHL